LKYDGHNQEIFNIYIKEAPFYEKAMINNE